ncbi:beta-eliminating lyase-related protein [Embleya sp. MST-111070]|uniref:beta-eliminating lyase-related protein n=1 Tax=Embleya sp. MST-111070 TaxID=3398231 RepID=UPI003F734DDD
MLLTPGTITRLPGLHKTQSSSIRARVEQVAYLGQRLIDAGVPVVRPLGGHAVCLDAGTILGHIPQALFPAQTLVCELYLRSGVRGLERGIVSAGRNPATGENRAPALELARLAIPRRVYTRSHLDVVADAVIALNERRQQVDHGLRFTYEPPHLRFFLARYEPVPLP